MRDVLRTRRQPLVLRWGAERLRVAPWRGDPRVAHVAPFPGERSPSGPVIARFLPQIRALGYDEALTTALAPPDQHAFAAAGFTVRERLHLLAHDLHHLAPRPTSGPLPRRPRRTDWPALDEVDRAAFASFWYLGTKGMFDALDATPSSRLRLIEQPASATGPATTVAAYAISGRAGTRGYLQRLAVAPSFQGRGLGRLLVLDGLRWMARRGADRAYVNTQDDNTVALALYESVGFVREPHGLAVLGIAL